MPIPIASLVGCLRDTNSGPDFEKIRKYNDSHSDGWEDFEHESNKESGSGSKSSD